MMDDNFSSRVKDVISYSKEEALRLGHKQIGTEHLLLGMLRDGGGKAISILNSIEVNLDELRKKIEILNPAIIDSSSIGLNESHYVPLDSLYKFHGIDSINFVKNNTYYASKSKQYTRIFETVESRLKDMEVSDTTGMPKPLINNKK